MAQHAEISDRFIMSLSYNGNTHKLDPIGFWASDNHGTACAGVAAAKSGNGICGQGIAPLASLAGRTIFGGGWAGSEADFAKALYNTDKTNDGRQIDINSNRYDVCLPFRCFTLGPVISSIFLCACLSSWGPSNLCTLNGCYLAMMVPLLVQSIQNGADKGRNGRGVVYLFAAGNDAVFGGTTSMNDFCKLAEVMCIAASDQNGQRTYYSMRGSGLFVTAPSSGLHSGDILPGTYLL
jgi:kexin